MNAVATAPHRPLSPTAQRVGALTVAVLSAASWFAWMGWDQEYVDPVTGADAGGPYEEWQVIGCGVSLIVIFFGALLLRLHPVFASVALVVAFTAAWTWTAARYDGTGLFMVGMVMVFMGLSMATAAGAGIALAIRHGYRALRRRSLPAA